MFKALKKVSSSAFTKQFLLRNVIHSQFASFGNSKAINNPSMVPKKVDLEVDVISKNGNSLFTVRPPNKLAGISRTPSSVCCVIDVSGSMGSEAMIQNEAGKSEGYGLSILDLVKHSVRTIIASLGDDDRLSLVTFSNDADVVLELTKMDEAGKNKAEKALEAMQPTHATNVWGGLHRGLEVLREGSASKNSSIFLLTDGQPNIVPDRGHLPMLKTYKDEHDIRSIINSFGFGYYLDSKLLYELAETGNGAYAFIPDGSLVGTIFVNALSNLLATVATNVCLSIELDQPHPMEFDLLKNYNHQVTSWGLELQLGSVMFGQNKNFVLPFELPQSKKVNVTLKYDSPYETKPINIKKEVDVQKIDDPQIDIQRFRHMLVNDIMGAMELMTKNNVQVSDPLYMDQLLRSSKIIKDLVHRINNSNVADVKYVKDMLQDLEGETTMALSRQDYFERWGKHFLPSLSRAHLLQQCNNFKDPGVQNYGGEVFNQIRDKIDNIFVNIPPPKPSAIRSTPGMQVQSMSMFYNPLGGCIDGDCIVAMADGTTKLVKDIVKGDEVLAPNGESAKVTCVVKTICENNKAQLVEFESGLKITPWHPIRVNGKFFFPCTAEEPFKYEFYDTPAVYNFVLDSHHFMKVNDIECITLAHGFQEDVARHEYYGTSAVIDDLQRLEGWNDGLVVLASGDTKRDAKTGMISGIIKSTQGHTPSTSAPVGLVI